MKTPLFALAAATLMLVGASSTAWGSMLAQVPSAPDWSLADPDEPKQAPTDKAG